jgi:hypothetical protein
MDFLTELRNFFLRSTLDGIDPNTQPTEHLMSELPENQDPAWKLLAQRGPVSVRADFVAQVVGASRNTPQDVKKSARLLSFPLLGGVAAAAALLVASFFVMRPESRPSRGPEIAAISPEDLPDHSVLATEADLEAALPWNDEAPADHLLLAALSYEETLASQDIERLSDAALLGLLAE